MHCTRLAAIRATRTALHAAEQRLLDAHAVIPIYHYSSKHLVSRKLCGYHAHPLDHHPSEFLRWCEVD